LRSLQQRAGVLLRAGTAVNTQLTYNTGLNAFASFRAAYELGQIWPTNTHQVILFMAYCFEVGRAPSTIATYIAGINYYHKLHGWEDFQNSFIITKALDVCKRRPHRKDLRAPITIDVLVALCLVLLQTCYNRFETLLFHALFTLAYFGSFRVGELVASGSSVNLFVKDLELTVDYICITLRYYKTNQRGKPVTVKLPREPRAEICPVRAIKAYLDLGVSDGPLFRHMDGSLVTRQQFSGVLAKCLRKTKYSTGHFRSHSFRIGRATDLAKQGLPDEKIMLLGRWHSDCFKRYVR